MDNPALFSIISPHFFGLLTGKNKANNFLLLVQTDILFGSQFTLNRNRLVDDLAEYIKEMKLDDVGDMGESKEHDEGLNESSGEDSGNIFQRKASSFVRSLENRGWLDRGTDKASFDANDTRTDAFIAIMKALLGLIAEEVNAKEEARYMLSLYKDITGLHGQVFSPKPDFSNAYLTFQSINEDSENLGKELLSVNSRIKRFVSKVMNDPSLSERELLKNLSIDYQRLGAYVAFHNLMTKYNPSKFSSTIISDLQDMRNPDAIEGFVNDYLRTKAIEKATPTQRREAWDYYSSIIKSVISQMDGIEAALESISGRNRAYVTSSAERIKFRLNSERDVKGDINNLLKAIKEKGISPNQEIGDCFKLYAYDQIDSKSTYVARSTTKIAPKKVPFTKREPSEELKRKAAELINQSNEYSLKSINGFVQDSMGQRTLMMASQVKIDGPTSLIRLMLIPIFSTDSRANYLISKQMNETFEREGFLISDYEIRLKGEKQR